MNAMLSVHLIVLTAMGDIFHEIYEAFYTLFGSTEMIGVIVFLFFLIFTLILGLGMLIGSVVLIPAMFLVFEFVPDMRIFLAIFAGLIVGLGLHKLINR